MKNQMETFIIKYRQKKKLSYREFFPFDPLPTVCVLSFFNPYNLQDNNFIHYTSDGILLFFFFFVFH